MLPQGQSPLVLRIVGGQYDNRTLELVSPKVSIGSGANCTLRLVGCGLRPVELFLLCGPQFTAVQNWSPRNLLNGRAFDEAQLVTGDRLTIGSVEIEVAGLPAKSTRSEDTHSPLKAHSHLDGCHTQVLAGNQWNEQYQTLVAEHQSDAALWQAEREQWIDELAKSRHHAIALQSELEQRRSHDTEASNELLTELELAREQLDHDAERLRNQSAELDQLRQKAERTAAELAEAQAQALQLAELQSATNQPNDAQHDLEQRFADLESRERHLTQQREELERAVAKLESQQAQHAEQQAAATSQSQPTLALDQSRRVGKEHEQALAELLHIRQELDQRQAELQQWERLLTEREAELAASTDSPPTIAENPTIQLGRPAAGAPTPDQPSSGTIVLSELDDSARTIADRLLDDGEYDDAEPYPTIAYAGSFAAEDELAQDADDEEDEMVLACADEAAAGAGEAVPVERAENEFFTAPKTGAPVSAAEILAKYAGDSYLDSDANANDDADELNLPEQPEAIGTTRATDLQPLIVSDNPRGEDDDSIRDYMDQLMRRVRGQSQETPAQIASSVPQVNPAAAPTAKAPCPPTEAAEPDCEVLTSEQYTPRSAAPERTDNLAKMRELANTSARSAINEASKIRRAQTAGIHLVLALGAAAAGVALIGFLAGGLPMLRYGTALVAFCMAAWWGNRAVRFALGREALPTYSFASLWKRVRRPNQITQPAAGLGENERDESVANAEVLP